MKTRRIGRLDVSIAGLGCNNFGRFCDGAQTAAVVSAALDAGVTFFDTADLYGDGLSETYLGRALGGRRNEAVIATKFGMWEGPDGLRGGKPEWVRRAAEDSLRRLGTDRLDVYFLHQPDPDTRIVDTLEAMGRLVAEGKVIEIGCSNFTPAQLDEASAAADSLGTPRFAVVQNEYSLLRRDDEKAALAACDRLDISYLPYFPLAGGMLTGKYVRGGTPPEGTRFAGVAPERAARFMNESAFDTVTALAAFAHSRGHSLLELALSWLVSRPRIASVIAGARAPEQVRANAAATTAWALTEEDLAGIDRICAGTG